MKSKPLKDTYKLSNNLINEIYSIISITVCILLLFCIYCDDVGILGKLIGQAIKGFLGIGAYFLPFVIISYSLFIFFNKEFEFNLRDVKLVLAIIWILISIIHISNKDLGLNENLNFIAYIKYYFVNGDYENGGLLGAALGNGLKGLIGLNCTYIFLYVSLLILIMMITKKSLFQTCNDYINKIKDRPKRLNTYNKTDNFKSSYTNKNDIIEAIVPSSVLEPFERVFFSAFDNEDSEDTDDISEMPDINDNNYKYPSTELMIKRPFRVTDKVKLELEMKENASKLERTLKSFGVIAKVLNIFNGPNVTRYEIQPKEGVKVSKIVNLSDDIALNLAASALRIEAPIPGKSVIGIEIPNKDIQTVYLREIIESKTFKTFKSKLAFGVGKDISGDVIVADIAEMPHILIAGATGSGKSVCINTIITSILYKSTPDEVKLIMIDPKVVELNVYNGIPHLLIPVVTDTKKATEALNWAVKEMIERYKTFAKYNVRDIRGYNETQKENGNTELMAEMVIIIDELSDLMMVSPKTVEDAICRLAQMARAAGIHLVIATQRPSVDVITGVIKANIPSRIAFAVSSGIDSRTILDMVGAEKLLGRGDMLFYPYGLAKPIRIQGAFISDKEVEKIVNFVKAENKNSSDKNFKLTSDILG